MLRTLRFVGWAGFGVTIIGGCSAPPGPSAGSVEQALCTPGGPDDTVCDGVDTDCDGLVDEDCTGPNITVVMTPRANTNRDAFFTMPWPSDHRRNTNGSLILDGFPLGLNSLHLAQTAVESAAPRTFGFGTNSAIYFKLSGDLVPSALPTPSASTAPDSPVMLVNLSDPAERIPLVLNYRSPTGTGRTDHLLTVLPFPGFSLKPNAKYAAVLFDNLPGSRGRLVRAPLLQTLETSSTRPLLSPLSDDQYRRLREDLLAVESYLAALPQPRARERIVGFAAFTTQNVVADFAAPFLGVAFMSDDQLLTHVKGLTAIKSCGACNPSGLCPPAELDATVEVPLIQTPVTLDIKATYLQCVNPFRTAACVASSGGDIPASQGLPPPESVCSSSVTGRCWQTVTARILVPCLQNQPAAGWPILVRAGGSGAPYDNVTDVVEWFAQRRVADGTSAGRAAPLPFNHVAVSITPYLTGDRTDFALLQKVQTLITQYNLSSLVNEDTLLGLLNYFVLNPVYARNNQFQGALEQLYLQKLLGALAKVAAAQSPVFTPDKIGLLATSTPFKTNRSVTTISGHSQGAGVAPIAALAFKNLHINSGAGLAYETAVHRGDARQFINAIYGILNGDFDRYHPGAHLLQTGMETSDIVNYASAISIDNVFVTAGDGDGCTVRESAIAFAMALERARKIRTGDTAASFADQSVLERLRDSLDVLGDPFLPLPASGNLSTGKTGVFLFLPGLHDMRGTSGPAAAFISDIGKGVVPTIPAPPYLRTSLDDNPFSCIGGRAESPVE